MCAYEESFDQFIEVEYLFELLHRMLHYDSLGGDFAQSTIE